MEGKDSPGNRRLQWLIILSVSMAILSMGIISKWTVLVMGMFNIERVGSTNQTMPLYANCSISAVKVAKTNLSFSKNEGNWLTIINAPSFAIGSLVPSLIADRYGRKASMLWSAVPFAIGTVLLQFPNKWLIYVTLTTWSIGMGMMMAVIGIYVAEISDPDIRGRLSLCTKYAFNIGQFGMLGVGPFMTYSTLNYCFLALPVIYIAACVWIPETPYFYMRKADRRTDKRSEKDLNDAKNILYKLKGQRDIDSDLTKMREGVKREMASSGTFIELVTGSQYRRAIYIAVGLKATQLMCGLVTVQQYLILLIRESTFCMKESSAMLIYATVNLAASILSMFTIDKVGRRPLIIGTYVGTGACLLVCGIYFFCLKMQVQQAVDYGFVPFVSVTLAQVFSTVGFGPIGGVVTAEIFPLNIKAIAMTSLGFLGGLMGMLAGKLYHLIDIIYVTLWVYASFAFLGGIFSYYVVTETKGKQLADIVNELAGQEANKHDDQEMLELKRNGR